MNWTTIAMMLLRHALSYGGGAATLEAFINGDWKTGMAGVLSLALALLASAKNKADQAVTIKGLTGAGISAPISSRS